MGFESITDNKIQSLLSIPKRIENPNTREKSKGKHVEKNYKVVDSESNELSFNLFLRQNTLDEKSFSCGLVWNMPSGEALTLIRYNGSSYDHPNHLENERLGFNCHIHKATEKYILAGKKPEGFAEATNS